MKYLKPVFDSFKKRAASAKVKAAVLAAGTATAMAPAALAADSGTIQDMNTLMAGFEYVVMLLEKVWELLLSNPLLCLFLAASLVAVGVKAFRKLKSAAKA